MNLRQKLKTPKNFLEPFHRFKNFLSDYDFNFVGSIIMFFLISMMKPKYFVVFISDSHLITFNCNPVFRKRFKKNHLFLVFGSGTIGVNQYIVNINWTKFIKKSFRTQLMYLWKMLKPLAKPNGITNHSKKLFLVLNVIIYSFFLAIFILWKTVLTSSLIYRLVLTIFRKIS